MPLAGTTNITVFLVRAWHPTHPPREPEPGFGKVFRHELYKSWRNMAQIPPIIGPAMPMPEIPLIFPVESAVHLDISIIFETLSYPGIGVMVPGDIVEGLPSQGLDEIRDRLRIFELVLAQWKEIEEIANSDKDVLARIGSLD
jgi:hypothetical protein